MDEVYDYDNISVWNAALEKAAFSREECRRRYLALVGAGATLHDKRVEEAIDAYDDARHEWINIYWANVRNLTPQ